MMADDSQNLLRDFCVTRSDAAFRNLVRKHSTLVYSTALRKLAGDQAAAEDVSQEVFSLLARKANRLENVAISGWLYRQTCRRAANHIRTESRRRHREKLALETQPVSSNPNPTAHLARELDDALLELPAPCRDAIVLRFFENQDYGSVGNALGITEEAARKRIRRALDRMEQILKRKGIAVTGTSLGTSMWSYGATPVPASLVSRIGANTAKTGIHTTALISILKPVAAGIFAASLAAGSTWAIQVRAEREMPRPPLDPPTRERGSRDIGVVPSTLQSIIAEIKRVHSGPNNAITSLRFNVAIDKIAISQIPEFVRLANVELHPNERRAAYETLLTRWLAEDPDAAMDFVLKEKIGWQVDPGFEKRLIDQLLGTWIKKDIQPAQAWLLANWSDPELQKKTMRRSVGNSLSMDLAEKLFMDTSAAAMSSFVHAISGSDDRKQALSALVGMTTHNTWEYSGQRKRLALYQVLKEFRDEPWQAELVQRHMTIWAQRFTKDLVKAMAAAPPGERFDMSLGLLGTRSQWGEIPADPPPNFEMRPSPVSDREARYQASFQAGLDAGMPPEKVFPIVARVMADTLEREEALEWFDRHRAGFEMDEWLVEKARSSAFGFSGIIRDLPGMIAIDWASRIADPELRSRICRGAFRNLTIEDEDLIVEYLNSKRPPMDLLPEFQAIYQNRR